MPARRHDQFLMFNYVVIKFVYVPHEVLRFIAVQQNGGITRTSHPYFDLDTSSGTGHISTRGVQLYVQGESLTRINRDVPLNKPKTVIRHNQMVGSNIELDFPVAGANRIPVDECVGLLGMN
jgi:hypothetical protein